MRVMLALTVLTFLVVPGAASAGQTTETQESIVVKKQQQQYRCKGTKEYINVKRKATWRWQDIISVPRTRTSNADRRTKCSPYLKWQARLWAGRSDDAYQTYVSLSDPQDAICHVFGIYCTEALMVARCESGHSYSPRAHNGQYLGMFQMGSSERRIYGHSDEPLGQARAAYAYFVASGRDWSPWSCKPY